MKFIDNKQYLAASLRKVGVSKSRFIFDLDSTLFNVTPRTTALLRRFKQENPNLSEALEKVSFRENEWGLKTAFDRANIELSHPLFKAFHIFWREHFFSSHFLQEDQPYLGAIEFVLELAAQGGEIWYLTGRDAEHMHEGTVQSLRMHQLPLLQDKSNLCMKPEKAWGQDQDYKSRTLSEMRNNSDKEFFFFENEPVILNLVQKNNPDVHLVYTDTVHSGVEEITSDIYFLKTWAKELEALRN